MIEITHHKHNSIEWMFLNQYPHWYAYQIDINYSECVLRVSFQPLCICTRYLTDISRARQLNLHSPMNYLNAHPYECVRIIFVSFLLGTRLSFSYFSRLFLDSSVNKCDRKERSVTVCRAHQRELWQLYSWCIALVLSMLSDASQSFIFSQETLALAKCIWIYSGC